MNETDADYLSARDGAKYLGVTEFTLRDAIRGKRIESEVRLGKIVVSRASLNDYRARTQPNGVPKVGRPSKAEREKILARIESRIQTTPFSLEQLIVERKSMSAFIGDRIRRRRIELGWSQKELGKNIGFSREAIAQYETGRAYIHAADLPLFAKVMEVHLYWFYADSPPLISNNPLWEHINALPEEDRNILDEIAAVLTRRRIVNSQKAMEFGPEYEASIVAEIKNEDH